MKGRERREEEGNWPDIPPYIYSSAFWIMKRSRWANIFCHSLQDTRTLAVCTCLYVKVREHTERHTQQQACQQIHHSYDITTSLILRMDPLSPSVCVFVCVSISFLDRLSEQTTEVQVIISQTKCQVQICFLHSVVSQRERKREYVDKKRERVRRS